MRMTFVLTVLLCSAAYAQPQSPESLGSKGKPSDFAISCKVDDATRTVSVTLANRTTKRCYFQRSGPLIDYRTILTTPAGTPVPPSIRSWPNRETADLKPRTTSTALIGLVPGQSYSGVLNLADRFALPKEGGKFRLHLGQSLFSLNGDALQRDPTAVVWCSWIDFKLLPQ
jgi:hypothetical protein